jgi:uncharacterized protein (TIGR03084 family)
VIRGAQAPESEVFVELSYNGDTWSFGNPAAAQRVAGTALDFCAVVTQRRHLDDVTLGIDGPDAREWMEQAQAYAGRPGPGRPPLASGA